MTDQPGEDVQVRAGAAGASAGATSPGGQPAAVAGPVEFATAVMEGDPEYGVRFTSDYEPGTDYPQRPPPSGPEQHALGLHPQAQADEAAMRKRNPGMQGTEEASHPRSGRAAKDNGG